MANLAFTYNSFDLNNSNQITTEIDDASAPERQLSYFPLVRSGQGVITDSTFFTKIIPVRGTIKGTSMANLESLLDTFLAAMSVQDKNLDVAYNSSTRRYVCTPKNIKIERPVRGADWAKFSIDFMTTEYGKDTSTTTLVSAQTHTAASNTRSLTVGGSAPEQYIRTQLTVTAATGLTGKTITVENDTTGELISVTRTWIVGDVLEIDTLNKTVKVNGTAVEFSGPLATYAPGTHDMIVTNDFTTRTITQTVDYVKRYL